MKTRKRKRIERIAIWLMTVIVAINYSVTIALAAEGIGQEELPEKETSSEVATVQVQVNPDALVDAAIYQTNSGVKPLNGTLPVGAVTVDGIPVLASVSLSVDAEAFAEKCAALQVEQYDPAWVFDAGYRSALRQNEATAFAWQEAAAMLAGVAVLNDSDRLVTLVVIPVQTGEEVALVPEEAVLVAGEPLEAELSGETQTPADESGADQEETSGSQDETETTDPSEETSSDEDTGESSSGEESQEPPENGETEESEPSSSEEQPTEDEDFSGEEDTTEGADGMDEEKPADEGAGMDEEESEPEPQDDPQEEEESDPEPESEPEPDPEPEETGEGSVEANAGRESHMVFYETAGDDAELTVDQGTEEPNEPQEEPEEEQKPEEPAPQPDQSAGDGQDQPQESDAPETDAPETDGADEPEDGTQTGETEPLPEEAIQQSESSVVVMNARPMGGVMMSFRATALVAFDDSVITINGAFTATDGGPSAVIEWYAIPKGANNIYKPLAESDNTSLSENGWRPGTISDCNISDGQATIKMPEFKAEKKPKIPLYLAGIPASGYPTWEEHLGTLTVSGNRHVFTPNPRYLEATETPNVFNLVPQEYDDAYRQYYVNPNSLPLMMGINDQAVYCFNEGFATPYANKTRYLKGEATISDATNPAKLDDQTFQNTIRKVLRNGYSGPVSDTESVRQLYNATQAVLWSYTDSKPAEEVCFYPEVLDALRKDIEKDASSGDKDEATISATIIYNGSEVNALNPITFAPKERSYQSEIIKIEGDYTSITLNLPKKVTAHHADGTIVNPQDPPTDGFYLEIPFGTDLPKGQMLSVKATKKFSPVQDLYFYKPAGGKFNVISARTESYTDKTVKKYQNLIGYGDIDTKTFTAKAILDPPENADVTARLHKVDSDQSPISSDEQNFVPAQFLLQELENQNNQQTLEVSKEDGTASLQLNYGIAYQLSETRAPTGYQPINEENQVKALFKLYRNQDGAPVVYRLSPNRDGYSESVWSNTDQDRIKIDVENGSVVITVPNVKLDPVKSQLTLRKVAAEKNDDGTDKLLEGAEFTLRWYDKNAWVPVNDENNPLKTGQDGQVTITDLSLDVPYMLTETEAPDGYNKLASAVTFMLAKENDVISVYQVNENMTRGGLWTKDAQNITVEGLTMTVPNVKSDPAKSQLTLQKVAAEKNDDGSDKLLEGAEFTLRWYNNNDWVSVNDENNPLKTGQNGQVAMTELSLDVPYRLTEITPPDGYNKLASSVTFMLAKENDVISVYQVNEDMTRGGLWATDAQNITVAGPIMTVPNVKSEEPARSLKLHLDHLVQEGYNSAYDNLVNGTDFKFALVKDGAVVATGVSHGQKDDVTWSTGGDTVDIGEGTYYLLGYNVEQPFQRVVHVYQEARNTNNQPFDPSFAGTAEASGGELREAASLVGGTPFMGVRINVTDADMTAYNGGTLYYHAESNLPMGRLTVNKTYYNRTYRNANDEFQFEVRKLGSRTDTFDQGTYYQTVTVRAGDGTQEINLPYGIYAIRETGMPSRYSFNLFASGAGVTYNPAENFARFSFPRSLLDDGAVNPANEWQVTVTAENRVHSNDRDDDDDDDNYRSDGSEEGGGGGGGGSDPVRSLFNHDDLVNIPEEAVPLTDKPLVEIPDEDVPLGALPNTGGFSMGVFAVLGAAITAIGVFLRKGKKSEA